MSNPPPYNANNNANPGNYNYGYSNNNNNNNYNGHQANPSYPQQPPNDAGQNAASNGYYHSQASGPVQLPPPPTNQQPQNYAQSTNGHFAPHPTQKSASPPPLTPNQPSQQAPQYHQQQPPYPQYPAPAPIPLNSQPQQPQQHSYPQPQQYPDQSQQQQFQQQTYPPHTQQAPLQATAPHTLANPNAPNQSSPYPIGIIGQPVNTAKLHKSSQAVSSDAYVAVQPACNPEYFRVSLPRIPFSSSLLSQCKIPFAISVTPYPPSEEEAGGGGGGSDDHKGEGTDANSSVSFATKPPLITGPILRCKRCRAYLNPYTELTQTAWICNLCTLSNNFPSHYDLCPQTNQYLDRRGRPELTRPVYDFEAPQEYMVRPPQPVTFCFVVDVGWEAMRSGFAKCALEIIGSLVEEWRSVEFGSRCRISLITFDDHLHFYRFSNNSGDNADNQPNGYGGEGDKVDCLVVGDVDDPFLPCPFEDLLPVLPSVMCETSQRLFSPTHTLAPFEGTQCTQTVGGSAMQAALNLIGPIGGKIVYMAASLPIKGLGALQPDREQASLYGTAKEASMFKPATSWYKQLSTECTQKQVCIDQFIKPSPYMDVATMGAASKFTGGTLRTFPDFSASEHEHIQRLAGELSSHLNDPALGLEAVLRIRASEGVSMRSYHGSFFMRSVDLLALPNVNGRHSFGAQLSIDANISRPIVSFQAALLHSTRNGHRRIRIINAAFPVCADVQAVVQSADLQMIASSLTKLAIEKALSNRLQDARDALYNRLAEIVGCIRAAYNTGSNPQLLMATSLTALPALMLAIQKMKGIREGVKVDERIAWMMRAKCWSVDEVMIALYPFMWAVHEMDDTIGEPMNTSESNCPTKQTIKMPTPMQLGSEHLQNHGLYWMFNGLDFYIWIGQQTHPELVMLLFGEPVDALASGTMITMPTLENAWNARMWRIINELLKRYPCTPSFYLVRQDDPHQGNKRLFLDHLVHDQQGSLPSYTAWTASIRDKIYAQK